MITIPSVVASLVILLGLAGIIVPVLPGTILIGAAIVGWAAFTGGEAAWVAAGIAVALLVIGALVKFAVPHRRLRDVGVPTSTIVIGGILGILGFFAIPVIGLFLGFVGGVWLAEARRLGVRNARPSTKSAIGAVGLSILIELAFGLLATVVFLAGVVLSA
ncbi:MAG TPA: DUF456 domain-containing protein [Aeromicrobium sp.]|nr:DUF456 domain-containing protein [Aeromicrobium sp.]